MTLAVAALVALAGCAASLPSCAASGDGLEASTIEVIDHGWHTDLALPADGLTGRLAVFRRIFPGVRVLVVGFGRRTFMMAPVTSVADLLVGPFPGRGAILAIGLDADPVLAYADGTVARLHLDAVARGRLDAFVWRTLALDRAGAPLAIGPGPYPGSVFYATTRGYSGVETCNTWTAQASRAAGLPVSATLDVFASQTMSRLAPISRGGLCRIRNPSASANGRDVGATG